MCLNSVYSLSVSKGMMRWAFLTLVFGTSSSPLSEIFLSSFSYSHFLAVFKGLPLGILFLANPSSTNWAFPAKRREDLLSWFGLILSLFWGIYLWDRSNRSNRWFTNYYGFSSGIPFLWEFFLGSPSLRRSRILSWVGLTDPVVRFRFGRISSIVSDISLR